MYSSTEDYNPTEWARFEASLDRIYGDFTSKVAEGRKLPKEKVLEIAKGRIWSGEDGKQLGLVDELGGYPVALRLAKEAAGIPESEKVRLKVFPAKRSPLSALLGEGPDNSEREGASMAVVRIVRAAQPIVRRLGLIDADRRGVLAMPPVEMK
jgi:protease-4